MAVISTTPSALRAASSSRRYPISTPRPTPRASSKHGTISLIEEGTLVVALCTYAPLFDKAVSNIVEVQARGADVIALTTEGRRRQMGKTVENVLTVPDTHLILQPSLGVIPLQLFAYYVALQRGCDIDKPRNLAKSVTVE